MVIAPSSRRHTVLLPVYNDWEACQIVLARLASLLNACGIGVDVLIVDDASPEAACASNFQGRWAFESLTILRLTRNLGSQRAIAVGLCHLAEAAACDAVIVMDADGEDRPDEVLRLIHAAQEQNYARVIFAARGRRFEPFWFRASYRVYCSLHRVLIGRVDRVGNFSLIPIDNLHSLVSASELWNHYSAAVIKSQQPCTLIVVDRGNRVRGGSQMNCTRLILHGLSAIAVHADTIGVRLLLVVFGLILCSLAGLAAVAGVRFFTPLAIPGWATTAFGLIAVLLVQLAGLAVAFAFLTLQSRQSTAVIPIRDYRWFVRSVKTIPVNACRLDVTVT